LTASDKHYTLEIAFTPNEYAKLVNVSLTTTKKALTEYFKGVILDKIKMKPKQSESLEEGDWKLYAAE
jgi:hypothetical protein